MPPTRVDSTSRLLEHLTSEIHDVRDYLDKRITEGQQLVTTHLDRLSSRVDEQGERLAQVETRVEMMCGRQDASGGSGTTWKRDGALVLSGGGVLALLDAALTWIGTHWPK